MIRSLDEKFDVLALNPAITAMKKGFNASTMMLQPGLGLTACPSRLGVLFRTIKTIRYNQRSSTLLDQKPLRLRGHR